MSNTSKILLNKVTDDLVIDILKTVLPIFEKEKVEYFIVGAFARDIGLLAAGYNEPPTRKTKDIDLAVMVGSHEEYEELISKLIQTKDLQPHPSEPYRLLFKETYEVDFLPFGEIADKDGTVKIQTFELNMPGFEAIFPEVKTVETEEGLQIKFSSLSGVILLKLLAFDDRSLERSKDIIDIDYILSNFYDLFVEEIVDSSSELIDLYQNEEIYFDKLVSAHFIGRELRIILRKDNHLRERLNSILKKEIVTPKMSLLLPATNLDDNVKIFMAMMEGLNDNE